ncbi:MAG: HGxxPAAW family protein [Nocardioides sp.]
MADNHGNSPAAWSGVAVGLAGFAVGSVGLITDPINLTLFWIGLALLPAALLVFAGLTKMGYGDDGQ